MFSQNIIDPTSFKNFLLGLRGALPYLEDYHGETFVIKISGRTLDTPNLPAILDDLILLCRIGIKLIIIHGAGPQIAYAFEEKKLSLDSKEGRLVIPEKSHAVALQAMASTNWDLITRLSRFGREIVPFSGHYVQATKYSFATETEPHCVGQVCDINAKALQNAVEHNFLPIIAPFAIGSKGRSWVLDPNQAALEIAVRLRARKLIILNPEDWNLPGTETGNIRDTTTQNMKEWLEQTSEITLETRLQMQALMNACERGVERCHWLNSSVDGALLGEVLTSAGTGIMITNSAYERIRFARLSDIHKISQILDKPIHDLVLVHKSPAYLERHIENFLVFCIDEELAGCCELIYSQESKSVEIASLAVKQDFRNRGIAKQLLDFAQDEVRKKDISLIFALTTKASHVFTGNGYKEIPPERLPQAKHEKYDFKDSLIYGKHLS